MSKAYIAAPAVLIIGYSFSIQTRRLADSLAKGFEEQGVQVEREWLSPEQPPPFPLDSVFRTFTMMFTTFFRKRMKIKPLSDHVYGDYDLIILAGPTWSYNPSGPILDFLDRYGKQVFAGKQVIPLISCRKYWRSNAWCLKRKIRKAGGIPLSPLHYAHPVPDPWNIIGVFLTIAGKNPRKLRIMKKHYLRYGHTQHQLDDIMKQGALIASGLKRR